MIAVADVTRDTEAWETLKAERFLREFVKQAWHVVEPSTEYSHNWHIDALCAHLEATLRGDIRNLLVTMPPRAMKSLVISVFFPAWAWIQDPGLRFLYASYAQRLSTEHSQLTRMVIESDWYQERWGHLFQLSDDDNLKQRFSNTKRGYRIAASVGSSVTGFGGDFVICDDPHNVQQAESDAIRQDAVRWWNKSMSTRFNDPKTGVRIVVMQRVHEDDVAGSCIERGIYDHLNLPMEYEGDNEPTAIGWRDPRTVDGELLWPQHMPKAFVEDQKRTLGSYGFAGQYQQRPAPVTGGILKRDWFGYYDQPQHDYLSIVQAWDTAFKTAEQNDSSACVTVGVGIAGYDVLDVYEAKLEFPDLERALEQQHLVWSMRYPKAMFYVLVEDKASGQSLIQSARARGNRNINVIAVPVARGDDKVKRVNEISPTVEAQRVRVPLQAHWLDAFLHEVTTFPLVKHDDVTDAFAIAIKRVTDTGSSVTGRDMRDAPPSPEAIRQRYRRLQR